MQSEVILRSTSEFVVYQVLIFTYKTEAYISNVEIWSVLISHMF